MKIFLIKIQEETESVKKPNPLSLRDKYFVKDGEVFFKTKIEKVVYSQKVKAVTEKDIQKTYGDKLRGIKFLEEEPSSPFTKLEKLYEDGYVKTLGKRRLVDTKFLRNSEQKCSEDIQKEYKRLGDMWFNKPINT